MNSLKSTKVVHQAIAKKYGIIEAEVPHYKCKPDQVMCNRDAKILWDSVIVTDRAVEANRPDLVVFDKKNKTATIIYIAVPLDNHIITTVAKKKRKYQPLAVELKDMYRLRAVDVVPVIVSTNDLVSKDWSIAKNKLCLQNKHVGVMQKIGCSLLQFCAQHKTNTFGASHSHIHLGSKEPGVCD